jgi:hypothetical protein
VGKSLDVEGRSKLACPRMIADPCHQEPREHAIAREHAQYGASRRYSLEILSRQFFLLCLFGGGSCRNVTSAVVAHTRRSLLPNYLDCPRRVIPSPKKRRPQVLHTTTTLFLRLSPRCSRAKSCSIEPLDIAACLETIPASNKIAAATTAHCALLLYRTDTAGAELRDSPLESSAYSGTRTRPNTRIPLADRADHGSTPHNRCEAIEQESRRLV